MVFTDRTHVQLHLNGAVNARIASRTCPRTRPDVPETGAAGAVPCCVWTAATKAVSRNAKAEPAMMPGEGAINEQGLRCDRVFGRLQNHCQSQALKLFQRAVKSRTMSRTAQTESVSLTTTSLAEDS